MIAKISRSLVIFTLIMSSLLFCLDLFLHSGEAATFDSPIHITNMATYQRALSNGDFPVTWADGFANYGLPTPLVSQQTTSYLGAALNFVTHSSALSYKLVLLIGVIIGAIGMYLFLKIYASPTSALTGSILFTFSAYRIINVYIRGALPELFASSLIPFVLLAIHGIFKQQWYATWLLVLISAQLIATHPFVFLISLLVIVPYTWYEFKSHPQTSYVPLLKVIFSLALSLIINAWYLFPLILEMKYFVISRNTTQLVPNQFLSVANYFIDKWPYFYHNDVFVRGNIIQFGALETMILLLGLPILFIFSSKSTLLRCLLYFIGITSLFLIFMTTSLSLPLYQHIPFLDDIQFPWRMLTALSLLPPIVLALLIDRLPKKHLWAVLVILLILFTRLPQVYGKDFTVYPESHYQRTIKNLHFDSLNTIWIGNTEAAPSKPLEVNNSPNRLDLTYQTDCDGILTLKLTYKRDGIGINNQEAVFDYLEEKKTSTTDANGEAVAKFQYKAVDDVEVFIEGKTLTIHVNKPDIECLKYPVEPVKGKIIEGNGQIISREELNSKRVYEVNASEPVRMIDYTFYFPGWKVFIDGKETSIEFQDVNYRGVITYYVPAGTHRVVVQFLPTKVRLVGLVITSITIIVIVLGFYLHFRVRLKQQRHT